LEKTTNLGQWLSPIATSQHRPVLDGDIALTFDLTSARLVAFAPIAQSEPCIQQPSRVLSCPKKFGNAQEHTYHGKAHQVEHLNYFEKATGWVKGELQPPT
jgi:hypothetical protein